MLEAGAKAGLAARLLAAGSISLGTAAHIADRTQAEMIDLMATLGHEDVFSDAERLDEDLRALEEL